MKNSHGYEVEVVPIEKVNYTDQGCEITLGEPGWGSLFISTKELNGLEPQVNDAIVTYMWGTDVRGLVLDGHVIRYTTPEEAAETHEQWLKNWRLEKLERYVKEGDALKERVKKLHPSLQARMARFEAEDGVEFWIDSAPYEMHALEGAQALLNKVESLDLAGDDAIEWVNAWWNKPWSEQIEKVPDFGEGHSGNTAGAAKGIAVMILSGRGSEL